MTDRINPECGVGKHPACNEDAWDDVNDKPARCECACGHGKDTD